MTVVEANGIGELVVGLPLDMAGGEGRAAVAARAWAVAVAEATGLPVTLRDERLSSHVAEGRVGPAKRGSSGGPPGPARRAANRARIDREAARVILEDELAARELGSPGEQVGSAVESGAGGAGDRRRPADRSGRPGRVEYAWSAADCIAAPPPERLGHPGPIPTRTRTLHDDPPRRQPSGR